ncbi:MBL fold metallo-hydrolase [Natronolimnohabitans innermongolicus]|uniref:Metallo-beta-lactamase superfamily protein n=1 Tax=Natronolimnohabitans innermongolicus JCM 12255 TaxID=1227499 RepID=L9WNV6_9EURY|nr:MBL fold metallo-hydrolase [Natronolimnohabitans innermongolicus]ELY50906.1 metallo-beta-lactamase superfamily protein [Natronolimnohabitans innermongolicus JCM 12255]
MYTEILPSVYDITVQDDGDARYRAFFVDADVPTLVDTGLPDTTDALFEAIEAIGLEPERVIITHGDVDHVGGLEAVTERYDVETFVPEGTDDVDDALVDEYFGDGDGIGPYTAAHVPGHASEHHVLIDEDAGYAVLGDAVFGSDARGLPAGYFVLPTAFFSEDVAAADENLERLLEYEFDAGLVFHGSSVRSGAFDKLADFVDFAGKP